MEGLGHLLAPQAEQGSAVVPRLSFVDDRCSHVRVAHRAIRESECASLVKAADETLNFTAPLNFDPRDRIAERAHTVDPSLSMAMMSRLRAFFPEVVIVDGARWRLTRFTHHWRFVRYYKGGHFAPHYDGSKLLPWHEMSMFTVQVYLNSKGPNFTGGDTRFYMDHVPKHHESHDVIDGQARRAHDVQISNHYSPVDPLRITHCVVPRAGDVLIFNHSGDSKFHDTEPVLDGCKYILRGDLMYAAVEEDIAILQNPTIPLELRTWCSQTGAGFGTRDFVGQVWKCQCANDKHGYACKHAGSVWQDYRSDCLTSSTFGDKDMVQATRKNRICVLISGKQASGKDYVSSVLQLALQAKGLCTAQASSGSVISRARSAKSAENDCHSEEKQYESAQRDQLLNDLDFKCGLSEVWRKADEACADILLLTDFRLHREYDWLTKKSGGRKNLVLLHIDASDAARLQRGWRAEDTLDSEIELDGFSGWDACFDNSSDATQGLVEEWVDNTVVPRVLSCINGVTTTCNENDKW